MRRNQNDSPLLWLLPVPVVLWLAALLATEYKAGMTVFTLMGRFSWLMEHPLSVRWTPYTLKFMLGALIAYGFAVALCCSTRENRRPGEEHGSAKWGSAKRLNAKYRDKDPRNNTILTQNVRMSLNGKMHRRNLLQIVIGGSGAGKTRFFVKPNLMEANCSFLVTDPKGETLRAVAPLLLQKGYVIKVFDLIDPARSDSFNAFAYIKDDKDVMKLVNNFIKNTTPKGAQQNDPFWERSEIALDTALILYLIHEAPPEEQNFEMLIYMIENGGAKEDDDDYQSPLDLLFEALEEDDPSHIAVREYKIYKQAAGVVCSKRLLNQAVGKSLRTHNLKPKKGAQVMRKNEKITALYERLSRDDFGKDDDQQRESNSISNQKAMLEEFAARQGFTNIVHFTDDGISGTCFDRPGFLAMMKEVEAGNVEYLCIKDMSRMGRDYLKVGQIMEILRQRGVRLIAINDGVDSARGDDDFTPFRNIMKNISHSGKVSNDFSLFRRLCCINRCFRCSCGKFAIVHGVQAAIGFLAAAIGEKGDLPETHPVQQRTESRRPCRSTRAKPASKGSDRALSV